MKACYISGVQAIRDFVRSVYSDNTVPEAEREEVIAEVAEIAFNAKGAAYEYPFSEEADDHE